MMERSIPVSKRIRLQVTISAIKLLETRNNARVGKLVSQILFARTCGNCSLGVGDDPKRASSHANPETTLVSQRSTQSTDEAYQSIFPLYLFESTAPTPACETTPAAAGSALSTYFQQLR
jgi:hypothetical protein